MSAKLRPALRAATMCFVAALVVPVLPAAAAPRAEPVAPVVSATLRLRPPPAVAASGSAGTLSRLAPVTRRVESTIAFSMVGFTVPNKHEVEFRTSVDGETWGPWRHPEDEVEVEDAPDAGSPEMRRALRRSPATRRITEPVWVREARWLETRVIGPRSDRVVPVAHVLDATGLERNLVERIADRFAAAWRGTTLTAAHAAARRPSIISRRQWGANESWRGRPTYMSTLKAAAVHHTAGSNSYSRSEAAAVVRGTYWYHTHTRGWSDLGYNFLVDRFGRIYEGRAGGAARNVMGAHAGGFNTATFGVSLMGEFSSVKPTRAMRTAAARLIAWKFRLNGIRPRTTVRLTSAGSTKYSAGRVVRLNTVFGHRDVSATACPGGKAYNLLGGLRRRVASIMGGATTAPPPPPDDTTPDEAEPAAPRPAGPVIKFSRDDSREDARRLEGRTVRGWIFVWSTRQAPNTRQVQFEIHPPGALDQPERTEYHHPYDFGWVNTHALRDGRTTIVARTTTGDGTVRRHRATFVVDNVSGAAWAWRINAGGESFRAGPGRMFQGDTGSEGGSTARTGDAIAGTELQQLHRSERYGMRSYHVRVPEDGAYKVRLHLSEIYWRDPQRRVFSAWAEGARMLDDYDIVAAVGARQATAVTNSVTVTDGVLDLYFWARSDHAKLAGFEIIRGGSGEPGPAVTTPPPPLQLMVSTSRWRSSPRPLQGATATGPIYVFLEGADDASTVAFHVNDPEATRWPYHTERYVPWDMAGTRDGNYAGSWDPRPLGHGDHSVTAVAATPTGTRTVTATFHVDP